MTLAEIEQMDTDLLTVAQVASCLKCNPQLIRDQAERNPQYLGFNIAQIGHAYKIPRKAFVAWMKGEIPLVAYKTGGDAVCV